MGKVVSINDEFIEVDVKRFFGQIHNKNTKKNYNVDINQFFKYMFGKPYKYVTKTELNQTVNLNSLLDYFLELKENKNLKNDTINRKQSSIKELLKFLKATKIYDGDLADLSIIKNLPKETNHRGFLSFDRAMEYVEWILKNEKNSIEKCLAVKIAIDTGIRVEDVLSLKWNQFNFLGGDVVLVSGYGKGGKKWTDKISKEKLYDDIYNNLKVEGQQNLFTIPYNEIARMMNRASIALGDEDKNITFHSFKKCAISNTFRLTNDVKEAQRKGRHANLNTTQLYIDELDYSITGFISLGEGGTTFEEVDHETLLKAIRLMNKDFQFILNNKVNSLTKLGIILE